MAEKFKQRKRETADVYEFVKSLLEQKRQELGINPGGSLAKCRRVNLEVVGAINKTTRLYAVAVRDPKFRGLNGPISLGEHIVGFANDGFDQYVGFDGTADQVLGHEGDPVLIFKASSLDETIGKLNELLGGDFTQQVIGPASYRDTISSI